MLLGIIQVRICTRVLIYDDASIATEQYHARYEDHVSIMMLPSSHMHA